MRNYPLLEKYVDEQQKALEERLDNFLLQERKTKQEDLDIFVNFRWGFGERCFQHYQRYLRQQERVLIITGTQLGNKLSDYTQQLQSVLAAVTLKKN